MSLLGSVGSAIGGGAAGLAGTAATAYANYKLQKDAQEHQKKMYRSRYQWTMEDMNKAGLNPILAYKQGPGSAGSTPMASVPDAGNAITAGALRGAQAAQAAANIHLTEEQARLTTAKAIKEERFTPFYKVIGDALEAGQGWIYDLWQQFNKNDAGNLKQPEQLKPVPPNSGKFNYEWTDKEKQHYRQQRKPEGWRWEGTQQ